MQFVERSLHTHAIQTSVLHLTSLHGPREANRAITMTTTACGSRCELRDGLAELWTDGHVEGTWSLKWARKKFKIVMMMLMIKVLAVMGQAWCTATSCPMKWRRRSRYWLYSSMSLCPAPSTQRGSTALGQRSNRARPWEKSITSSSVPWMMSTGDVILDTFSMLGGEKKEWDGESLILKKWIM